MPVIQRIVPLWQRMTQRLSGFQIKLLAILFMTIDHVGAYAYEFPWVRQHWFLIRRIGRIAAPLFLFMFAQSLRHTGNRRKLMLRLYLAGICLAVVEGIANFYFDYRWGREILLGNIFASYLNVAILVELLESAGAYWKTKENRTLLRALLLLGLEIVNLIVPAVYERLSRYFPFEFPVPGLQMLESLVGAVFPGCLYVEYGAVFVLLGAALYFARGKWKQCGVYAVFCLGCILYYRLAPEDSPAIFGWEIRRIFTQSIQLRMIYALPLMALYNGRRGRPAKWLFYWYYPAHIILLSLLPRLL